MHRWLFLPVLLLCSCAAVWVHGGFQSTDVTEVGLVSFVQFTSVSDGRGSLINVTIVTLSESGLPHNAVFCGNHPDAFPMNTFIRAHVRPGENCGSILSVAVEQRG